jgi:2-iminobutanoate/2-iminopropanoate deaminase
MKSAITSPKAPKAIGPYSQAIELKGFLYISGQLPLDEETGKIPDSVEAQARTALDNIDHILKQGGYSRQDVIKTTIFLKSMSDFDTVNKVYAEFFDGTVFPARSTIEVARLPRDALIEIETIAAKGA